MKFLYTLVLLALIWTSSTSLSFAQCDTDRFKTAVYGDADISVIDDVTYGSNADLAGTETNLKFDFYHTEGDTMAMRPLIIWAHGGTFISGNENSEHIAFMCEEFTKIGYVNASINYRLVDVFAQLQFVPQLNEFMLNAVVQALEDIRAAVRFFRKDAAGENLYRINPNQIFVGGASAGGFMALHAAYFDGQEDAEKFESLDMMKVIDAHGGVETDGRYEGNSGNAGFSSEIDGAVINLCGALGDVDFLEEGDIPLVSIHGDADNTVPYGSGFVNVLGQDLVAVDGSSTLHAKMDAMGIENKILTHPGADHMSYYVPENQEASVTFVRDFLANIVDCNPGNVVGLGDRDIPTANILVYPNPIGTSFTIELTSLNTNEATIEIFNNLGQLVQQLHTNTPSITINRGTMAAGVYQLRIVSDGQEINKKIILN